MLESERQAAGLLLLAENPSMKHEDINKEENAQLLEQAHEHLLNGGYHIYTTIDKKVYNAMHKVGADPNNFEADSKEKGMEQTGAIMLDHKTGAILGMLEGRDFYTEQLTTPRR